MEGCPCMKYKHYDSLVRVIKWHSLRYGTKAVYPTETKRNRHKQLGKNPSWVRPAKSDGGGRTSHLHLEANWRQLGNLRTQPIFRFQITIFNHHEKLTIYHSFTFRQEINKKSRLEEQVEFLWLHRLDWSSIQFSNRTSFFSPPFCFCGEDKKP